NPILVVDDDPATRDIVTEILQTIGWKVATAADGYEARAYVQDHNPELVILDLILPGVNGFELLAEWRASERTADLPVFVLTGKDLTQNEERYLEINSESLFRKSTHWQRDL